MSETKDSSLEEINILNIKKDEERLRSIKQANQQHCEETALRDENTDSDDLSKYTHEADGVKVLDSTSNINRKAIFHDLDRLKRWRASFDSTMNQNKSNVAIRSTIKEEPIMDQNVDLILNSMPSVTSDKLSNEEAAWKKLNEIERKLERKYSLSEGKVA